VTSFPDVKKVQLKADHDFIVVACDGIWDCFTNEQAAKFVRTRREKGPRQLKKTQTMKNYSHGKNSLKPTKQQSEPLRK
jgi:serine/threonine protein phosphatase PrpC